ncbi:vWA domain-containing protein [Daejeonella lutea]|uniref:N-terminal double-transmembrane domain-containing protein n=1 Tax=Daejeonella lutea TaxID=572036 RepID=A0A1T5EY01_9SPHI|nr:BatA and WFA domain-containing protein [Daejeonella lutea]SKB88580.1 N-terminal double-transmembrane domain-containing protein [Daejeonella lutea]
MRFLSPGFLFALLAIAIPIIIHLFNFRKFKKVYFSNVRFLKFVQIQTSSRQHLKDRLILASRILAIAFLVFAFARPYIPNPEQKNTYEEQVVSIFIDNSFSMEALNKEGTLLDEAKRRAKEIASAYSFNDKFQLLTNDFEGRFQRLLNYDEFQSAVDEVKISSANRDLSQIIRRQEDVFTKEPNSKKTVYVVSDFQDNILPSAPIQSDTAVTVRLVRVKANAQPNISIDSVWFASAIHKPGDPEQMVVKLRNNSDEEAENIPVRIMINKQQKAIGSLSIAPRATSTDTLSFSGLKSGWQEGEIEITDFPVVFDDRFYFSFNVQQSIPLLIINGGSENEYLNSVYRSDVFFNVSNVSSGNINYSGLNNFPLIVLNEVAQISDGLIQQLRAYVNKGGSLMVFPELLTNQEGLRKLLQTLGTDVPAEIVTAETKVSAINLQHPIFKGVFENIPQKLDLPIAKKYLRYSSQNNTTKQSVLDFPGRGTFFGEYRLGRGKIYLSAVPLNAENSNFARHSVFVPVMYQTALLSLQDQNLFHKLNRDQVIELPKLTLNANQTLKLKKDKFEAIPDLRQNENASQLYIADQIRQIGNYQLLKNDSLLAILSFNDAGPESNLSYATDRVIKGKFPNQKIDVITPERGSMQAKVKSINQGTSLWKLCIILALLFLAAEIMLIRFYKKSQTKAVTT